MLKRRTTWLIVRNQVVQSVVLVIASSAMSVAEAQQTAPATFQSSAGARAANTGWRPAKPSTLAIARKSAGAVRHAGYQEYSLSDTQLPDFAAGSGPELPSIGGGAPVSGESLALPNLQSQTDLPANGATADLPSAVPFGGAGQGDTSGATPPGRLLQNDLRSLPSQGMETPPEMPAANASTYSMPQMTAGSSRIDEPRAQSGANIRMASGQSEGSTELRTQRDNSPSQPSIPPMQPMRNQVPARQVTTGQPFVSPPPAKGNYQTRPYNPAFYQLAAYQRGSRPTSGAIGKYPPRPVQPVGQQAARTAPQSTPAGSPGSLASTPTRFTSNASPMPATSLQGAREQNPGFYQTSFNTDQCVQPGFPTGAPGTYVPPTITPNMAPNVYSANNVGYRPLFTLGQENFNVVMGRGIIGQPTVYVAGQPFRNFFRYLSP